jgi:hypothetical protein
LRAQRRADQPCRPAISSQGEYRDLKIIAKQLSLSTLVACVFCACALIMAGYADVSAAKPTKPFDVKNTFRNICGFYHEDHGRHTGKGPQLMDDPNSDEFLFERIKDGKPGRVAAFGGIFTNDQIHQMVVFIRNLQTRRRPRNP